MSCDESFTVLKTVCDRTIKDPSKQHLAELQAVIRAIPPQFLQQLQEYVLFPLELHLRRPDLGRESKRHIVDCIKELLNYTEVVSMKLFLRLYTVVFLQVFNNNATNMVADVPEELKLSVVECASTLIEKANTEVLQQLYQKSNIPKLSQGIYMCVEMMQKEKFRSLRVQAMRFIMTVAYVHDGAQERDATLQNQSADMLTFVLPGILRGLHQVATGDEKQGHLVTLMAIRAWSRILVLMMEDGATYEESPSKICISAKVSEKIAPKPMNTITESKDHETLLKILQTQSRSPEWIAGVAEKVALLVESLTMLQRHPHPKVRLELAISFSLILNKCLRNLKPVSMNLVDVLLKLSDDEIEEVAVKSNEAIDMLTEKLSEENETSLLEILEENFYNLITKMPRILHGADDTQQLAELRLLMVYLKLLGADKLPHVLRSVVHLRRLILSLIQVVELETTNISLLEDCSLREMEQSKLFGMKRPWKQFKHFTNKEILVKVETICRMLGQLGDLDILCDHLLDLYHSSPWHQRETILILNEIVAGGSKDSAQHIVKNVLDVYLEPSTWYLPLSVMEDHVTMGEAQCNIVTACLLVEGIGKMALMLGSKFDECVLRTLYVVVERAGSTHQLLAIAGTTAAEEIAVAGGHGNSIASLLAANMDYFSFHVTLKLRKVEQNPGVLDVLSTAMKNCNMEMLPTLRDIVDDVLLQSCDTFQDHHSISFLQVFYTFFVCIQKWLEGKSHANKNKRLTNGVNKREKVADNQYGKVVETLVKYHENKLLSRLKDEEMEPENMLPEPENENEDKPDVPDYVKMTECILKRCLHFVPSKDRRRKLLALETLQEGIQVLADWEDQLLPIVHLVWSPLMGRFDDALDSLILNRSFSLLYTLATHAKDFIRSRTLKNVLPSICQYLSHSAKDSKRKDSGSGYYFTQAYKVQYELLDKLGELAIHLVLQEKELHQLLSVTALYMSSLQPLPLQERCVKMFETVATFNEDAVWLQMTILLNQVVHIAEGNSEFQKNAELVLQSLQ